MPERILLPLVSCEHGGNRVPASFRHLFDGCSVVLSSHRAYDAGARTLARRVATQLHAPLHVCTITRLLIDVNRSPHHPRLFSAATAGCAAAERRLLRRRYYEPYRRAVTSAVAQIVDAGNAVLHLSVHTFCPAMEGVERTADIGVLYDPSRACERWCADRLVPRLRAVVSPGRVRRNYPYRGVADGLTTSLRRCFPDEAYVGIELEVNQRLHTAGARQWRHWCAAVAGQCARMYACDLKETP